MPTWGEILVEIQKLKQEQGKQKLVYDIVRRKYLEALGKLTGRNTILYMSKWTTPGAIDPELLSINDEDVHGLMEVLYGLSGSSLDLILHSPGGTAEATEALVTYLRSKFNDIRVIVPQAAMSAATMLSCASNRIVMGKHSSLGPIDPQMILNTPLGPKAVPAQAILDQFKRAQQECKDPSLLGSWLPMLSQYGPALLIECHNAQKLSEELVSKWLEQYMFKESGDAKIRAGRVAAALANHGLYLSHGRHISRDQAKALGGDGLIVDDLEADQVFQDAVLSVFHAAAHTFNGTQAVKLIENHKGRAYVKLAGVVIVEQGPLGGPAPPDWPTGGPSSTLPG